MKRISMYDLYSCQFSFFFTYFASVISFSLHHLFVYIVCVCVCAWYYLFWGFSFFVLVFPFFLLLSEKRFLLSFHFHYYYIAIVNGKITWMHQPKNKKNKRYLCNGFNDTWYPVAGHYFFAVIFLSIFVIVVIHPTSSSSSPFNRSHLRQVFLKEKIVFFWVCVLFLPLSFLFIPFWLCDRMVLARHSYRIHSINKNDIWNETDCVLSHFPSDKIVGTKIQISCSPTKRAYWNVCPPHELLYTTGIQCYPANYRLVRACQ